MGGPPTHVAPIIGLDAKTRYMFNTKPMVSLEWFIEKKSMGEESSFWLLVRPRCLC